MVVMVGPLAGWSNGVARRTPEPIISVDINELSSQKHVIAIEARDLTRICSRAWVARLDENPLYLIHGHLVVTPIIQRRGTRGFMSRHLLCELAAATIAQVGTTNKRAPRLSHGM
jgi:hypothetical protein